MIIWILQTDKLIFDVTEDPKSEEEDNDLEKVVQGELGLETTRVHRPDAPQVRAVHLSSIRRR